jgi:endonuclease G
MEASMNEDAARQLTGKDSADRSDKGLLKELSREISARDECAPEKAGSEQANRAVGDESLSMRVGLIEPPASDPFGYERILGKSDLLSINWLERGRRSAEAVCRIKLPMEGGHAYGTGLLVGPRLLLTNNHVLANPREAAQAEAEFGYDHDLDGVVRQPVQFNFDPDEIFFTSAELDVTLVAVAPIAENGTPLERYGWLPLIPLTGKTVDGEWVTMIQHPSGHPKQIAIHASRIVKLDPAKVRVNLEQFIHYSTDTEPGSSGAPLFNDQWQVVALHHKAVPLPGSAPESRPSRRRDDQPRWLANEGVRISAIFKLLERYRFEDPNANSALERLNRGLGFAPLVRTSSAILQPQATEQFGPYKITRWSTPGLGYDPDFLSESISLDAIYKPYTHSKPAKDKVARLLDGSGHELRYWHYSAVLHAKRKFALLTAVNIDGNKLRQIERKDTWRRDVRIADEYQPDDAFYVKSRAEEKVYFSRGHLVRLLDPCWGDTQADADRGMQDTFHFSNAAPQVQTYNDVDWGNLEDYVLDQAQTQARKLSVFTGPIFRDDDPLYGKNRPGGPWQIPLSFWKIAVLQKTDEQVVAAAFIIGQTEYVRALYEAKVFSGLKPYTLDELRERKIQTTIAAIEEETGLDFSAIRPFDAHGSLESTRRTRWITRLDDIQI